MLKTLGEKARWRETTQKERSHVGKIKRTFRKTQEGKLFEEKQRKRVILGVRRLEETGKGGTGKRLESRENEFTSKGKRRNHQRTGKFCPAEKKGALLRLGFRNDQKKGKKSRGSNKTKGRRKMQKLQREKNPWTGGGGTRSLWGDMGLEKPATSKKGPAR